MPSSNFSNASSFRVSLDNPQAYYTSGNVLTGRVVFNASQEQAIGEVRINLIGRAKTKIVRNNGQSRSNYRGRAVFFDIPQLLYQGHFTHKADTYIWPFSIPITARAQSVLLTGDQWESLEGFISTRDQLSASSLPPTYKCEFVFRTSNEAFVEYKLLARLTEPDDARRFTMPRTYNTEYPLDLSANLSDNFLTNFPFHTSSQSLSIRTMKLLPKYANALQKQSFKQKACSFFNPSSLPAFLFKLSVSLPNVVQLDHPDPVPVMINAQTLSFDIPSEGDHSSSSTNGNSSDEPLENLPPIPNVPLPQITLTGFSLSIKTRTCYRAKSPGLFNFEARQTHHDEVHVAESRGLNLQVPLTTPESLHANVAHEKAQPAQLPPPPLNLGAIRQIYLSQARPRQSQCSGTPTLYPSFRTCNIGHSHSWRLKLEFECAGERKTVDVGSVPLEVLGKARLDGLAQPQAQTQALRDRRMAGVWEEGGEDVNGVSPAPPVYKA